MNDNLEGSKQLPQRKKEGMTMKLLTWPGSWREGCRGFCFDAAFNNASIEIARPLDKVTEEQYQNTFSINQERKRRTTMRMMITAQFDQKDFAAIGPLVPAEQAHVRKLTNEGTIESFFLSADRLYAWLVMKGESQEQIEQVLQGFPLAPYVKAQLVPLF
jgi:muconolactone delta-isomerase